MLLWGNLLLALVVGVAANIITGRLLLPKWDTRRRRAKKRSAQAEAQFEQRAVRWSHVAELREHARFRVLHCRVSSEGTWISGLISSVAAIVLFAFAATTSLQPVQRTALFAVAAMGLGGGWATQAVSFAWSRLGSDIHRCLSRAMELAGEPTAPDDEQPS